MPTPLNQKPPMAAWIVRERKRLKLKPRDLVERLAAQGLVVTEATVKVWEANGDRRPAPENIEGLERIFESGAPSAESASTFGQSDMVAAMDRQTAAIDRQTDMLERVLTALGVSPPDPRVAEAQADWTGAERRLAEEKAGTSSLPRSPGHERRTGAPGSESREVDRA
jgi:hypothetical protein